jgi:hypothetical protein
MAAPERFAETSDSSCIAGAVHTWHFATGTTGLNLRPLSGPSGRGLATAPGGPGALGQHFLLGDERAIHVRQHQGDLLLL